MEVGGQNVLFTSQPMNWQEGQDFCMSRNGMLYELDTMDPDILATLLAKAGELGISEAWLGASDMAEEGT